MYTIQASLYCIDSTRGQKEGCVGTQKLSSFLYFVHGNYSFPNIVSNLRYFLLNPLTTEFCYLSIFLLKSLRYAPIIYLLIDAAPLTGFFLLNPSFFQNRNFGKMGPHGLFRCYRVKCHPVDGNLNISFNLCLRNLIVEEIFDIFSY